MTHKPAQETPEPVRRFGRDLTTGSIPRHLVIFSLPMLAGSALQTAYSFINAIWVGKYLGTNALAAVTVSMPVVFTLIAAVIGLTLATNILVSQYYGARNMPALRRVVDSSTVVFAVLSAVLLVIGEIFTPQILRAMNTPPDVLPLAVGYMRIFLTTVPATFGMALVRSMLQGIGDSKTPLYYQTVSVILTAVLDPILMLGWLGAPKLGLNGTAWATLFTQVLALVAIVILLRKDRNPVAPRMSRSGFDWPTVWTTVKVGVPSSVQQSLISVGMLFIARIVNGFGETATAAWGAAMRVDQLAFMPAMTLGMAVSTLSGQNIGARLYHRVREVFLWGCLLSGAFTLSATLLVVTLPRLILRIFTDDVAVIDLGADYLRIVGSCYILFAIMFASNGVINGSGHTLISTLISLVSLWVVRVPLATWLAHRLNSINGVWYAVAISFGVSMLSSLAYYLSGRWRRPIDRHQLPTPASPEAIFAEETGEA